MMLRNLYLKKESKINKKESLPQTRLAVLI